MGKRLAAVLLAESVASFIFEGGCPTAMSGYDPESLRELGEALDAYGYAPEARQCHETADRMSGAGVGGL